MSMFRLSRKMIKIHSETKVVSRFELVETIRAILPNIKNLTLVMRGYREIKGQISTALRNIARSPAINEGYSIAL
jgi:hypothetical protein